ncbi:MAG: UDP-N-acetylglucosamine 1-carboxyvinyltransferase [Patescibacteria group bacterium]
MKKDKFIIQGLGGEKTLSGKIRVNGAKNAVLPVMASSVLFQDGFILENIPNIEDIHRMEEIFGSLGIKLFQIGEGVYEIDSSSCNNFKIDEDAAKRMRAAVIFMGPVLARFGKLVSPHPGGCVIGSRPIDFFLEGFKKMGVKYEWKDEKYYMEVAGGKLKGAEIFFKVPSVTATEAFILAGILAEGKTILKNVAMEPEIMDLIEFLNSCGAKISGGGSPIIEIEGGELLRSNGKRYRTMPDRLETGSFLILGALCASDLEITHCRPKDLEIIIEVLRDAGVEMKVGIDSIRVNNKNIKNYKSFNIKTHEYPGFPTDLQSPMLVFLTQTQGEALVFETIFEGRLNYTEDLQKMGADIKMWDSNRVTVKGPTPLKGRELDGPDIRSGFAFVIAGLVAKKESIINNVYYIDRGYESIEKRLEKNRS